MLLHFKNCLLLLLLLLPFQLQAGDSPYKPKSNTWVLHSEAQTEQEGSFVLLGVAHTFDVKHQQLTDLKRIFETFKPSLVLLEGGTWPSKNNIEAAVECCGEMGFMTFLAEQSSIQVETWEGNLKQEALSVLEKYNTRGAQSILCTKAGAAISTKWCRA
ncbi:hypothetical protein swp_5021 [Shewanella piezotolerans WP3]|uniref:Uncharacterized protein n=1 Tax=Shewanella piezotolerans (strain WP3 / JCM 13877) TaxID=225849 RepID=B8CVF9_SHEPW|nr:hypothetical protein [Shewanella piezotolerans]ACJ31635.1 hypothetical protein swp_5021 [Shewanella piezotolerans WP3]